MGHSLNMNIKFRYLYRDGANYKSFNEIIFRNRDNLNLKEVDEIIRAKLIDSKWFVATDWKIPDMHFKEYSWDSDIDHEWHEFENVEETTEDAAGESNIETFLFLVSKTRLPW
jgi:hypothetical protein